MNNSIKKNDISTKDDKQYSRVIDTVRTQGNDDYEEEIGVDVVQTLDNGGPNDDNDDSTTPKYYADNVIVAGGSNNSVYGKVNTQSTTDRKRLGNDNEYDADAFDNQKVNQSVKRGNANQSMKGKMDLNKSGKGKDGKGGKGG